MAFVLPGDKQVTLHLAVKDAMDAHAVIEDVPEWEVSDPAVLALEVAPDGMSATAYPAAVGTCQVSARLGDDVAGTFDVRVVGGSAVTIEISPALAEPIAAARRRISAEPTEGQAAEEAGESRRASRRARRG